MQLLIVDDEPLIRRSLERTFIAAGESVACASSGAEAQALLQSDTFDCAVIDLRLGDTNGLDLLRRIRSQALRTQVIIITAHGDVESAIAALRLGAYDFIRKPFDLEEVITAVNNAVHAARLEAQVAYLDARVSQKDTTLGDSPAMQQALAALQKIAAQPVPVVLVRGESGTGKELAARLLHDASRSAAGPFIELNCSALPEPLVESELFGHERGAFSDAKAQKRGLVELAEGGTLFLDEIGDLPAAAQAKLLKFVETQTFRRVGGTRLLRVQCRIVAATHKPLEEAASFRQDLLYRLAGFSVVLPPLRQRGADVLLLARHFLAASGREYGKPNLRLTAAAEQALMQHTWPGNVRELRAVLAHAALFAEGAAVDAADLRLPVAAAAQAISHNMLLDAVIDEHCRRVLAGCGGNKALAAQKLGIGRHTLARRLHDD